MKQQVILVILDGWGIGPKDDTNPIHVQGTPNLNYIKENFLAGSLQASGISVGLPWNEEGNSEVGHLTIGAGKVLYQHFPRITLSIRDGSFAQNPAFLGAFAHAKKNNGALHLAGLITQGNIHASLEHLFALINLVKNNNLKVNLHIFSDGKDSEPQSVIGLLSNLKNDFEEALNFTSISGRFYALDRDNKWNRTQLTYDAMTGNGPVSLNIGEAVKATYAKNLNDQFIEPRILDRTNCIKENDALIFFDFREDSIRQIASAFADPNFSQFPVQKFKNMYVATMTQYADSFQVPVAYSSEKITQPLAKVLSDSGKSQLHIAETEKYAHVTYFFNGYQEPPFPNEYRILVPSHGVSSHAEKPEMQASEITARAIETIREKSFDFLLVNYANADIIAHTGNYEAAKIAVKIIDDSVGSLIRAVLEQNAVMIITSDHGNIENMINPKTGAATTTHDLSPVPIYIIGNEFAKPKSASEIAAAENEVSGILSDVAPTILSLLDIPKPVEMTGQNLLPILKS